MSNVLVNETSLQNIASAIRTKNESSDTYTPSQMATAIGNIKYKPKQKISFSGNTSQNLDYEIANLDVSNITNFNQMFYNCSNITSLDLSNWNTLQGTDFGQMFKYCSNLTSINLSNFNSSSQDNDIKMMFQNCTKLTHIDFRSMDFHVYTEGYSSAYMLMFGSSGSNGVPNDCEIIVKNDIEKAWFTNNTDSTISRLTNVKTVAEYEGS